MAAAGFAIVFAFACGRLSQPPDTEPTSEAPLRHRMPNAGEDCAWYGDRAGDELVFGIADFWRRFRESGGRPEADLEHRAPRRIGRFDLAAERFLPTIDLGAAPMGSGTWDVLPLSGALSDRAIAFTSLFESSAVAEPVRGGWRVRPLADSSHGLSELAPGPDGGLLATRYAPTGAVVVFDALLRTVRELPLPQPSPGLLAAKSVAYDPQRRAAWVTTDRLDARGQPLGPGIEPGAAHPTLVLSLDDGRELARIEDRELHFVRFDAAGRGVTIVAEPSVDPGPEAPEIQRLVAIELARHGTPAERLSRGRTTLLEARFDGSSDFAQDLTFANDGRFVVTRWSGAVHIVDRDGGHRRVQLPPFEDGGLYYTAVLRGQRVCATYCADISVVCTPLR